MSSQPANTQISVFRTLRSRTPQTLFQSIKERTQRVFDRQEVLIPGEEIDVLLTLDGAGTNAPGPNPAWRDGMPVSVIPRTRDTVATLISDIDGDAEAGALDFSKQIVGTRHDRFLQNTSASVDNDLHEDGRRNSPAPRGLARVV